MERDIYTKIYSKSVNYGRVFTFFKESDVLVILSYYSIILTILSYINLLSIDSLIIVSIPAVVYLFYSTFLYSSKQDNYLLDMLFYYSSGKKILIPDSLDSSEVKISTLPFLKEEIVNSFENDHYIVLDRNVQLIKLEDLKNV